MNRKMILDRIYSIQECFPDKLLSTLYLEKVNEDNFDELFSRSLITASPVYLPIFEKDGNLLCLHCEIGKDWKECSWVYIFHDYEFPDLIASSFRYLPYAFYDPILTSKRFIDEIWDILESILSADLERVDRGYIDEIDERVLAVIIKYDLENIPALLSLHTSDFWEEEAKERVEHICEEHPDNVYAKAALAKIRILLKETNVLKPALGALKGESIASFYPMSWNTMSSIQEVLELIREAVVDKIEPDEPLALLKECSYTDPALVDNFKKVADAFNEKGEPLLALNQLRNAASIMGGYGSGITKEWCQLLGEQADRVEKDCLSAKLAYYATEVIDLEP